VNEESKHVVAYVYTRAFLPARRAGWRETDSEFSYTADFVVEKNLDL
jgi:hypothetical protein